MQASLAKAFFQCLEVDLQTHDHYALTNCPLAQYRHEKGTDSHPSFRVSLGSRRSWAKCYACQWRGSLGDLLMELQARKATHVGFTEAYSILDKEWEGLSVLVDPDAVTGIQFHPGYPSMSSAINCTSGERLSPLPRRAHISWL